MGQVIKIAEKEFSRAPSGDAALLFIEECYGKLEALPDFVMRPGQMDLSLAVCKALVANEPLAAEAPTGTGKTIAYLVGALAARESLSSVKELPIVVATATVGLQGQIITGDLPKLVRAGILESSAATIAKGRGRYFCASNAERVVGDSDGSLQDDFFDAEANENSAEIREAKTLLEARANFSWAGDLDSYKGTPPVFWAQVAATNDTCTGTKCDHYNVCPFFQSRRDMSSAKVIVANHDLVLADLAMSVEDKDPLFPGDNYLVVFDEAHHLPEKALEAGSAALELSDAQRELLPLAGYTRAWQKHAAIVRAFDKQKLQGADFNAGPLIETLKSIHEEAAALPFDEETCQFRFKQGAVPGNISKLLLLAASQCDHLVACMRDASQAIKSIKLEGSQEVLKPVVTELLYMGAKINGTLGAIDKALGLLNSKERAVRWCFKNQENVSLHSAPLEGADVLRRLLWGGKRARVAMVSATLQDFEGFERYRSRSGAPESMRTMALPHIFPYRENTLYVVDMLYSPKQEEKASYQKELIEHLPGFIRKGEGTLILFPSRILMNKVLPTLVEKFGDLVLSQGSASIKDLVTTHKNKIDAGTGSILCGLATMAEGLDLPGDYCTHVVICALPFTAPTSPVERELQEVLGKDYFAKRALPDTLVKLVQMVGRLMRRETDRGRITIFDKRLFYTKWGMSLLGALPRFKISKVHPAKPPVKLFLA